MTHYHADPGRGCALILITGILAALALTFTAGVLVGRATAARVDSREPVDGHRQALALAAAERGGNPEPSRPASLMVPAGRTPAERLNPVPAPQARKEVRSAHVSVRASVAMAGVASLGSGSGHTSGTASWVMPAYGPLYLALPVGPGHWVWICGAKGCVHRVSTDAGPDLANQRAGRVADLSAADFLAVCGPLARGTCPVTVQ